MRGITIAGIAAIAALTGVLAVQSPGSAQKNAKDEAVGFVDLAVVTDKIKQTAQWRVLVEKFENSKSQFKTEIEGLTKIRYLSDAERSQLESLRAKKTASDSEKKLISDMEKKSDALDMEYQQLAQREKLTDQDSARLKELTALRDRGVTFLQTETEKRAAELQKLEGQVLDDMQGNVLKIVGKVAQDKKLLLVIDRQAVLAGGTDLTPEILTKLPK